MSSAPRSVALLLALAALTALSDRAHAQLPPASEVERTKVFESSEDFMKRIKEIINLPAAERQPQVDALWKQLSAANQIPFARGRGAAFLYRGPAASVGVAGDFNKWKPTHESDRAFRIAETDLWVLTKSFPIDARLDYKLVIDDANWIVDPANPLQMWSGFGGMNSELRMPGYRYPHETIRRDDISHGQLSENLKIASKRLGYDVNYRVYTPAGYTSAGDTTAADNANGRAGLPVVYATDGHEYAADYQGSLVIVLDNLIADKKLQPTIAVFIDPRDPVTGFNRRMTAYGDNENYIAFLADELVPAIDAAYRTRREPDGRVILGTSLGGLSAAACGAARPDIFGRVAIQSPASFTKYAPRTLERYAQEPLSGRLKLVITAGTIGDGDAAPTFAKLLAEKGYRHALLLTNEGHSWGNFRASLDDLLPPLIGPPN